MKVASSPGSVVVGISQLFGLYPLCFMARLIADARGSRHFARLFRDARLAFVNTPERSTAAAFPRYLTGEVVADSVALQWPGLFARRFRFPRVVDRFLVPATPEPHISCNLRGMAEFRERDVGGNWITRQIRGGDLFVTRSRVPYEVRFQSPPGGGTGQHFRFTSLSSRSWPRSKLRYPGKTDRVEVVDFFGSDEILWHICLTCAELLAARVRESRLALSRSRNSSPLTSWKNTRTLGQRSRHTAAASHSTAPQSAGLRRRASRGRNLDRASCRTGGIEFLTFCPCLQGVHRHDSAPIRNSPTNHTRPANDPRNFAQPYRSRT